MSGIALFEQREIRREWDEAGEKWWFSVVDVVSVLTDSVDGSAYWRKLKQRLREEGNETVTNCHRLRSGLCITSCAEKPKISGSALSEILSRC